MYGRRHKMADLITLRGGGGAGVLTLKWNSRQDKYCGVWCNSTLCVYNLRVYRSRSAYFNTPTDPKCKFTRRFINNARRVSFDSKLDARRFKPPLVNFHTRTSPARSASLNLWGPGPADYNESERAYKYTWLISRWRPGCALEFIIYIPYF